MDSANLESFDDKPFEKQRTDGTDDSIMRNAFNYTSPPDRRRKSDELTSRIKYLETELLKARKKTGVGARFSQARNFLMRYVSREKSDGESRRRLSAHIPRSDEAKVAWINSPMANTLLGGVIVVNAAYLGVETDAKRDDLSSSVDMDEWLPWFIVESIFLAIFSVELSLRLYAHGLKTFKDWWNCFDAVLVSLGILDTWILQFVLQGSDGEDSGLSFFLLLRVVRLVRLARVLRLLRLFRFLRELTLLAQGILGALRALGWSLFLIWIVLYVSAVLVTTMYSSSDDENIQVWFGRLGSSLLTLFQLMTLEDWPSVVRGVMNVRQWQQSWLFFVPFIGLTNFVLLNVITGVVVERVLSTAEKNKEAEVSKADRQRLEQMQKLNELFKSMDEDCRGELSRDEFNEGLQCPELMEKFYELGFMKSEVEHLFNYLEVIPGRPVRIFDLVEGCLRSHGQAMSKHLLRVQYDLLRYGRETKEQISDLSRQMRWIGEKLSKEDLRRSEKRRKEAGDVVENEKEVGEKAKSPIARQGNRKSVLRKNEKDTRRSVKADRAAASLVEGAEASSLSATASGSPLQLRVPDTAVDAATPAPAVAPSVAVSSPMTGHAKENSDEPYASAVVHASSLEANIPPTLDGTPPARSPTVAAETSAGATAAEPKSNGEASVLGDAAPPKPRVRKSRCHYNTTGSSALQKERLRARASVAFEEMHPVDKRGLFSHLDELIREQAMTRTLLQAYSDEVSNLRVATEELHQTQGQQSKPIPARKKVPATEDLHQQGHPRPIRQSVPSRPGASFASSW